MKIHRQPTQTELQFMSGESLFFQTQAGSYIITTSGSLVMTGSPRWVGERISAAEVALEPGAAEHVDENGWVTLTAGSRGAVASVVAPAPASAGLANALGRTLRWVRAAGRRSSSAAT